MDVAVLKRFNFALTEGKSGKIGTMTNRSWGKRAKSARNWLKMRHGP
jgi:hypothetical protein